VRRDLTLLNKKGGSGPQSWKEKGPKYKQTAAAKEKEKTIPQHQCNKGDPGKRRDVWSTKRQAKRRKKAPMKDLPFHHARREKNQGNRSEWRDKGRATKRPGGKKMKKKRRRKSRQKVPFHMGPSRQKSKKKLEGGVLKQGGEVGGHDRC